MVQCIIVVCMYHGSSVIFVCMNHGSLYYVCMGVVCVWLYELYNMVLYGIPWYNMVSCCMCNCMYLLSVDGCMDGWMDALMYGYLYVIIDVCMDGWIDARTYSFVLLYIWFLKVKTYIKHIHVAFIF